MPDTPTHGIPVAVPASAIAILGTIRGDPLFDAAELAFCVAGSMMPDFSELYCWRGIYKQYVTPALGPLRPLQWFNPTHWPEMWKRFRKLEFHYTEVTTKQFEELEREKPRVFIPYKLMHSLIGMSFMALLISLWSPTLAVAWAIGHFIHIALDVLSHRKTRPLWPIPILVEAVTTNWWEWEVYRKYYWRIIGCTFWINVGCASVILLL